MMSSDDKLSLEILSNIVIQLKANQTLAEKTLSDEMALLKLEQAKITQSLAENYKNEISDLKFEISELKEKNALIIIDNKKELNETRIRFEKEIVNLREDMLTLLKKYEKKFVTQDDEIDNLKTKCELSECSICCFQSFKVHFSECEDCSKLICSDCLITCKSCNIIRCSVCLVKCTNCDEILCNSCKLKCDSCELLSCKKCFSNCYICKESNKCNKCIKACTLCNKIYCYKDSVKCDKCANSVVCNYCYTKGSEALKCLCGQLYCFNCEDDCKECNAPCLWENQTRLFVGFHTKTLLPLPEKCLVKVRINNKGNLTTQIGVTNDTEFRTEDSATENFWALCLDSGEKFSSSEYRKKGTTWMKYAVPVVKGDYLYLKYDNGNVSYMINRKEYPIAFKVDKKEKYYLYCLTHNDSTEVELKCLKINKN